MRQREAEAATEAQATISAHVYHEIRNVVSVRADKNEEIEHLPDIAFGLPVTNLFSAWCYIRVRTLVVVGEP